MSRPRYVADEDAKSDTSKAPIRLMSDFLRLVEEDVVDAGEALKLADKILQIEPTNSLVAQYRTVLEAMQIDECANGRLVISFKLF